MKRLLNPTRNPAGWVALASAACAVTFGILNARGHHTAVSPAVIAWALSAFGSALTRQLVTPVADPCDGNGSKLVSQPTTLTLQQPTLTFHAQAPAVAQPNVTTTTLPAQPPNVTAAPPLNTAVGATPAPPEGGTAQ